MLLYLSMKVVSGCQHPLYSSRCTQLPLPIVPHSWEKSKKNESNQSCSGRIATMRKPEEEHKREEEKQELLFWSWYQRRYAKDKELLSPCVWILWFLCHVCFHRLTWYGSQEIWTELYVYPTCPLDTLTGGWFECWILPSFGDLRRWYRVL